MAGSAASDSHLLAPTVCASLAYGDAIAPGYQNLHTFTLDRLGMLI